ncbi:MAG: alanine dehydrogenase [Rhodobacteraceae bacterium]|nr:alanine dehydrogenase [Paracoccaceae bacterium]
MLIGVPREIKDHEYRVGLTPESVHEIVAVDHTVIVETNAGQGIGSDDEAYIGAGAEIAPSAEEVFDRCDMIIKVKEPQAVERAMLREDQILFTYLHLAPDAEQTADLVKSGAICIAYETVTDGDGGLPLLRPMSQVAGRMSIQAGAGALEKARGGRGVLLGGVPGVKPGRVVILGGGVVGFNAAQMAAGMQADVMILDRNPVVLESLNTHFGAAAKTAFSTQAVLREAVLAADLVIGAVLIPGASTPKLVTRSLVSEMKPGAVIVDVAVDQGGCFATTRATTHADPTYVVDEVVHYCVANMPGAVARTSTYALNNVTVPHALAIANHGWRQALSFNRHLLAGLNVIRGTVTYRAVADELGYDYVAPEHWIIG